MRKYSIIFLTILTSSLVTGQYTTNGNASNVAKKAIFIIVDGIPADIIEKVETPVLDEIATRGGYTRAYVGGERGAYTETPTISAPGYMNLITGTWGNKHRVVNNYHQKPNYNYYNIFRIVKEVRPELKTAIFSTWEDNRTVLIGEGLEQTDSLKLDYSFDGFEKDTINFPHDPLRNFIKNIDEKVAKETGDYIRKEAPDLSWVYLEYTDDVGHGFGDSPYFNESVKLTDQFIKYIWDAIKARENEKEEWMVIITTDHGRDGITGRSHGRQSKRERTTWMTTNYPDPNMRFQNEEPPIVDILPSILNFMEIEIPDHVKRELDGTSFIGDIHASNLKAELIDGVLSLKWDAYKEGVADVLLSFTNNYFDGGKDLFLSVAKNIAVDKGVFSYKLTEEQQAKFVKSGFVKVVFQSQTNTLNRWIVETE